MSWEHGTYGWERFESFLAAINLLGIKYTVKEIKKHLKYPLYLGADLMEREQKLRKATFTVGSTKMVVEEYLAVKDYDCDGADEIKIEIYKDGKRPNLKARLVERKV